jgi:hypothetical protein
MIEVSTHDERLEVPPKKNAQANGIHHILSCKYNESAALNSGSREMRKAALPNPSCVGYVRLVHYYHAAR